MTRYGMAINMDQCIGCQTCVVSCQLNNALRPGSSRNSIDRVERGRWPNGDLFFFPHACIHCDEPLCVKVCPTGASSKRTDGIVAIDHELCIGCGVCITACEFGARSIGTQDEWHYGAKDPAPYEAEGMQPVNVADKCTFCSDRIDAGLQPACVSDCVAGIRVFGDLDDPDSAVNAYIREHRCVCSPDSAVYYGRGARDFDVREHITETYYRSAKADREGQKPQEARGNPAVVGIAGAATAAAVAGLGVSARNSRKKGKRNPKSEDRR